MTAVGSVPVLDTTHFDTVRFPPPAWALEEFTRAARDGGNAYTPYRGSGAVLAELADGIGELMGFAVDPEREVVLTPGTQGALFACLAACARDATAVVVPDPDYLYTTRMLAVLAIPVERIPLRRAPAQTLDLDALEAVLSRGRALLVFSNPNNPTGAVYEREHIAEIAQLAAANDATVIVDELYARLVYGVPFTHLAAEAGARERCLTLLGPSKTESLSGYRLGAVVGPAPLVTRVEEMVSILSLRAPAYAQHVLRRWLREEPGWLEARVSDLRALRDLTVSRLRALEWVDVASPDAAAYVFPDLSATGMSDDTLASVLEERARVRFTPGSRFGPSGHGHLRACFARDEAAWDAALDRLVAVLAGLGSGAVP